MNLIPAGIRLADHVSLTGSRFVAVTDVTTVSSFSIQAELYPSSELSYKLPGRVQFDAWRRARIGFSFHSVRPSTAPRIRKMCQLLKEFSLLAERAAIIGVSFLCDKYTSTTSQYRQQ